MFSNFNFLLAGATRVRQAKASIALSASNTTVSMAVFQLTGAVWVIGLWAEVTTGIGANHTRGHFRINDQSATVDITEAATGTTLSGKTVGAIMYRYSDATKVMLVLNSNAADIDDPAVANDPPLCPFLATQKVSALTTIDYRYSTTDTPTSGVLRCNALWVPLSDDGNLA